MLGRVAPGRRTVRLRRGLARFRRGPGVVGHRRLRNWAARP
jgi:hypothetical protein